ncbi:MAG: hypothetical protein M3Q36_02635 [bacterium]|nr:hypothetical protein [bacterium]
MNDKMRSILTTFTNRFKDKLVFFILIVFLSILAVVSLAYAYRNVQVAKSANSKVSELDKPGLSAQQKLQTVDSNDETSNGNVASDSTTLPARAKACDNQPKSDTGCVKSTEAQPEVKPSACQTPHEASKKPTQQAEKNCD